MSQNNQDEIDLGYLFGKISSIFTSIVGLIFSVISFFLKYIIIIVILIIVGVGIGYFIDKNKEEVYNNELIVIPNFESTQYLYDKVDAISSKLRDGDTEFFQKIIGENYGDLRSIEAEPIVDIFKFASETREKVDLFKALTEKQDIPDYLDDPRNFQYNKYQHLTIKIKGKDHSEEIVNKVITYLNDNEHFNEYLKVGSRANTFRIETSQRMLSQIDTLLKVAGQVENNKKTSPSVLVNDNSQLNDLLESKERILFNLDKLYILQVDQQEIIKVASVNYNVTDFSGFHISNKVKYPLLLVLLFSGFFFVKYFYNKMKVIAENNRK